MKCCVVATVVILISMSGTSHAQTDGQSRIPKKVQESLERLIGTWNAKGFTEGKAEYKWDLSKTVVIGRIEFETEDMPFVFTSLWYWDKKSKNGVITSRTLYNDLGVINTTFRGKVLPGGAVEGKQIGKGLSDDLRIEHQSPNQFTIFATNIVEDGEKVPDIKVVFTRSVPISPEQKVTRNKAQLRRYFEEVFNKRDLSNARKFISPSFKRSRPELGSDGDPGYVTFFKGIFARLENKWYNMEFEVREIIAEGNNAAVLYKATGLYYPGPQGRGKQDAAGIYVELNAIGLYEFDENGLLLNARPVEDASPLVRAEMEHAQKQQ